MFNFRILLTIVCIWATAFCMPLSGQYSEDSQVHYTVNDGLPSSTCYDLLQDEQGFLWIATEGGLTKYDGQNFKTFTTSNGLVDNEIVNIQKDNENRIWMNTNGPLTYIINDSVYVLNSELNTNLNWDFKVLNAKEDILWISRVNSINAYDAKTLDKIEITKPTKSRDLPYFIAGTHEGSTWIAYKNILYQYKGSSLVDSVDLGKELLSQNPFDSYFHIQSPHLYYVKNQNLYKYHLRERTESIFCEADEKIRQLVFKEDVLWMLTQNGLHKLLVEKDGSASYVDVMLKDALCSRIIFDENDNMWTAIYKDGLKQYTPENKNILTTNFENIGSNNLESVLANDGKILLGSEKGDLYTVEEGKINNYKISKDEGSAVNRILDILPIKSNGYIISTDNGICHFVNGKFKQLLRTNGKNIFLKGDRLLINSYNRLYEGDLNKLLSIKMPLDIHSASDYLTEIELKRSYTSLIDREDNIWNANVITGLSKRTKDSIFYYKSLSNIFNCTISRIIELDNGIIAAVTKGEGLILIKDKVVKQITSKNGLSSNFCYDVDAEGNQIFIGTNKGLSIVELKDFVKFDFTVRIINQHNGLESNEVQDLEYFKGKLYLATNNGLVEYDLSHEAKRKRNKKIFITEFQVNGETRKISKEYIFSSTENNLRIQYISPDITSNENIIYAYQLEGVDEDWIYTTSNETHYSNLESGEYRFKYKLGNNENSDPDINSFDIVIEPQFVESSMFKILILSGLGVLFLIPLYLSYHSQQQSLLATLLQKKSGEVEEKMQLLQKSNTRLVSSNKELEQFAYIASHDLQEPINTIKGFSDMLKKKYEETNDEQSVKMLEIISSSSSRMKSLVQDLLIFSRIGKEKKKSMVDMNALLENIMKDLTDRIKSNGAIVTWDNLPYIPGYQVELRSLFQNLLSNAMKFQKPGVAPVIKISSKKIIDGVEFSVKDNGIGISDTHKERIFEIFQRLHNKDEYEGTGIGLAHCKKIVALHHGDIWVESELGEGCNFKFTIEA